MAPNDADAYERYIRQNEHKCDDECSQWCEWCGYDCCIWDDETISLDMIYYCSKACKMLADREIANHNT